jgi:valyl-tRNA synthetase
MSKPYEPQSVENKWYDYWLESGAFKPSDAAGPRFSMVIPPPNVTGSLHMGHALNVTLQDILARWKRMKGFSVLWVPGTDHAGIATQNVVEKQLAKEGLDRHQLGREAFIRKVWQWKAEYGGKITHQLKKLGVSCDWSHERFTLDEGLSQAVREVFVSLFDEGLIYRSYRLINWCPRCYTALSDLETEHEEAQGRLTYIRYPVSGAEGAITVATTRPETMLGDSAVAVNPEDARYTVLVGKTLKLPLTGRTIPVIADAAVDPAFGTGAVKVTPAHDFNDEAMARRQSPNLPFIIVIGEDGRMTDLAGKRYAGLDRYECRKLVIKDLKEQDLIEKEDNHKHSVGHCYRCRTVIEPLPTVQWYVDVKSMSEAAVEAVRDGSIRIIPDGWQNSYYAWMKDVKDWCISRQIWWGHRIPVWYCPQCRGRDNKPQAGSIYHMLSKKIKGRGEGTYEELRAAGLSHDEILTNSMSIRVGLDVKPIAGREDLTACPSCGAREILRDPDVLDTWFSSALWPFSTMGWPERTRDLQEFYPTGVLVTAHDILFFWVARMIMMGIKFMGDVPFRDVYIHALIRDFKGQKMSKSKGNVIDPLTLIEKYGADAFRFTLAAFAAQGRDIKFAEDRVEGYRFFINKLWNAANYLELNVGDLSNAPALRDKFIEACGQTQTQPLNLPDRWILGRLAWAASACDKALGEYRFNDAASALYQFTWHEFCDWYVELTKTTYAAGGDLDAAKGCLVYVFDGLLKLLHPFMPFVTEELWSAINPGQAGGGIKTVSLARYPERFIAALDEDAARLMQYLTDAVGGVRTIRGELNISPSKQLKAAVKTLKSEAQKTLLENKSYVVNLARLEALEIGNAVEKEKGSAVSVKADMEVYVPLSGLFDVQAELERLDKELRKIKEQTDQLDKKLLNEDFISRAPKAVVEKEKAKYEELGSKKERISQNIAKLRELS